MNEKTSPLGRTIRANKRSSLEPSEPWCRTEWTVQEALRGEAQAPGPSLSPCSRGAARDLTQVCARGSDQTHVQVLLLLGSLKEPRVKKTGVGLPGLLLSQE